MKNTDAIIKNALNSSHMAADEAAVAERERHKNQPRQGDGNQFNDVNPASITKKGSY